MKTTRLFFVLTFCVVTVVERIYAQGTAFTYQGVLGDQGLPANGVYDLQFRLFDAPSGGGVTGGPLTTNDLAISNGLFAVTLDFGVGVFTGPARWLEIGVRPGASSGAFTNLSPRQALLPGPYAIYSGSANAAGLLGTISSSNIGNATITSNHLAADSVTSVQIATGSVTTSELAGNSVTASKIADSFQSGTVSFFGTTNGSNVTVTFPAPFELPPIVKLPNAPYLVPTNITTTSFQVAVPPHRLNLDSGPNTVGRYLSMALVSGNPAIAYFDEDSGDLKYVRATTANGSAWGAPVVADVGGTSLVGKYASMVVVNGRPAVAYMDDTADNLLYIRANDATGATWPASPVTVVSTGDVGYYAQLKVVNGIPSIAYFDNTTKSLQYVRASNADGTTWGAPITVEAGDIATNTVGEYASMEIVNGFPAIAYRSDGLDVLRFCRALNADGTAWDVPVNITSGLPGVKEVSLAMSGTRPAVAYVARDTEVFYEISSNTNGTSWANGPVVLGAARSIAPSGVVLRELSNIVHVAYWQGQLGDVMYTRASSPFAGSFDKPIEILSGSGTSGGTIAMLALNNGIMVAAKSGASSSEDLFFTTATIPDVSSTPYTARNAIGIEAESVAAGSITREMLAPSVFGQVITAGPNAFAVGTSRALFDNAFAAGESSVASGAGSFAGGRNSVAAAPGSVALGNGAQATGGNAVALGENTLASGAAAVAFGQDTVANGDSSTALGENTTASGFASFAAGNHARALHQGTFVWADTSTGDFVSTANNQFLIRTADGVGINTNNPAARLHVNGSARIESATTIGSLLTVSNSITTGGNVNADGNVRIGGFPIIEQSSVAPAAGSTLAPTTGYVVLTPAANVTLDATTAIANGSTAGQMLILQGNGNFFVTVPDNANTRMAGTIVIGNNDVLTLIWNGSDWVEVSFSDN